MNSLSDQQLLRDYTGGRSEAAFAELVRRHVDLVYSAALRMVRDSHLAEDVTQGAFVALARNAGQLADRPVLSGWLHRTAQNLAVKAVRTDARRRAREQEAVAMNELLAHESDAAWEHIAPHLDAVLGELSEADHDALLLRYFERKSAREMAQTLGISDEAAQKRVNRAVERLREFFAKRGVTVGASGLVVVISANAVQAAPVGLAVTISAAVALAGTAVQTSIAIAATKTIAMTTLQKTLVAATLIVAVGTGIYEARQASLLRSQVQTFQQQAPIAEQIQQLTRERDDAARQLAALRNDNERFSLAAAELLKLRGEVARLKAEAQEMARLRAGNTNDQTLSEAVVWKKRVGQLKQYLEQTPTAKIPELQFVTEQDWLDAARGKLATEADFRRASSALRGAGENKVAALLRKALTAHKKASNEEFPTDINQLQPYFDAPMDPAILDRWHVAPASSVPSIGVGEVIITQRAPIDDVFDRRLIIGSGGGQGSADFLSQETWKAMTPVFDAYRAANNGQWQTDFVQLEPYARTPEQQAALQKLMLRESSSK